MEQIIDEIIKVTVNGKKYKLNLSDLAKRLEIDASNLDYELEHQAAFYYWIATLATNAVFMAEEQKHAFEVFYSELINEARSEFEKEGGKAPAATIIEATVKSQEEYQERLGELMKIKRIAALFETAREAVRMRQFLLIERSKRISKEIAAEYEEDE